MNPEIETVKTAVMHFGVLVALVWLSSWLTSRIVRSSMKKKDHRALRGSKGAAETLFSVGVGCLVAVVGYRVLF